MADQTVLMIHYSMIGLTFALPALSIALGQGLTARIALRALDAQPAARNDIRKNLLLGLALNETAVILSALIVIVSLMSHHTITLPTALGQVGIFFATAIPCALVGFLSSLPHQAALTSTARQPFFARKLLNLMFIALSIMQTSSVLGLIMSFLIQGQLATTTTLSQGMQLLATGLAFGLGSIGPLIGLGIFARSACASVGFNREVYPSMVTFTFFSQALIETPILFALVVALIIISSGPQGFNQLIAALVIGLSTVGPGIASGRVAGAAATAIGAQPPLYGAIARISMLAQTLIDTSAIYGLILSLALLFFI